MGWIARLCSALVIVIAVLTAGISSPATASAAAKRGSVSGKLTGLSVPAARTGVAQVRAIELRSGRVAAAVRASRSGAYRLSLPAGAYSLVGSVLDRRAKTFDSRPGIPVSLRAGQKRTVPVVARNQKKKKKKHHHAGHRAVAAPRYVQESGKSTPGVIAYQVHDFTGLTGDVAFLSRGISDIVQGDMVVGGTCPTAQVANPRDLKYATAELELQKSTYFDPATRIKRDFIVADMTVTGQLRNTPGGATYRIEVRNARSGGLIATKNGELRFNTTFFAQVETIGPALLALICAPHPPKVVVVPPAPPLPPPTDPDGLTGTFSGDVDLATSPGPVPLRISWTGTLDLAREPYGFNPNVVYDLRSGSVTATISGTIGGCAVNGSSVIDLLTANFGALGSVISVEPGASPNYRTGLAAGNAVVVGIKSGCASPSQNGESVTWPLLGIALMWTPSPQTAGSRFAFAATTSGQPTPADPQYHWTWSLSGPPPPV